MLNLFIIYKNIVVLKLQWCNTVYNYGGNVHLKIVINIYH